jgi:hypothetical protein
MSTAYTPQGASNAADRGMPQDELAADLRLRRRLIGVAWASLALSAARWWIDRILMPFDRLYGAVIGLMWPTRGLGPGMAHVAFRALDLACFGLPLVLAAGALLWSRVRANPPLALRLAYELAFILPLLSFVASGLSRVVANLIYAASGWVSTDYTPLLARLEGHALVRLQTAIGSDFLSWVSSVGYSDGWLVSLLLAVPILLATGGPRPASHLIAGWLLAAVLAIPFFLLLPVYEPWTVNPAYTFAASAETGVRFLTAGPPVIDLATIASDLRWATGCCFPSFHVAMPVLVSRIAYQNGARWIGRGYATVAWVTAFTVVYLGRHWIVDVLAAVPFAWCVARLTGGLDPSLVPAWPSMIRER